MYRELWRWWSLSCVPVGGALSLQPFLGSLLDQQIDKRQPFGLVVGFGQQLPIALEVKTRMLIRHLNTPPTPSPAKCSSNRARAQEPRAKAADQSVLRLACSFQAMVEVGGTIPGQNLCLIGLAVTFHDPDLFGAPFFRSVAEFGSDTIWIDKLLSEARSGEYEWRDKN